MLVLGDDEEILELVVVWFELGQRLIAPLEQLFRVDRHNFNFRYALDGLELFVADDWIVLEDAETGHEG